MALAAAPAVAMLAGSGASPSALADPCGGGVNMNLLQEGAPISTNCGPVGPAPITAGAPSQQDVTACSNRPGCLSSVLYGPGNVQVPNRSTTVQQSQ
ncbi:MAG: hypothetical protein JWR32_2588 [Mycobacterium sp.]|jgi:hypothetical protein|nr:hypothetical protein [Mycobacterium sp.]